MAKNSLHLIKKNVGIPAGMEKSNGSVKLTIKSVSYKRASPDGDGVESFLHFRDGDNYWAIEPAIGSDELLELYGRKLAIDFFDYNSCVPGNGELAKVLASMPAKKGPIELGFIAEVEHLAQWMANSNH
jgi:hypothetical protein